MPTSKPIFVTVSSGVAISAKSTSLPQATMSESSIWLPTVERTTPG